MSADSAQEYLARRIVESGGAGIPVEEFMREALYHPAHGYYRRRDQVLGPRGDFTTSPLLNRWLARAIAGWLRQVSSELGLCTVLEVGAGDGSLAEGILKELGWLGRRRFGYHIVEISEALREVQQRKLSPFGIRWHADAPSALEALSGEAFIISNELVDAFPCVRLIRGEGEWREGVLKPAPDGMLHEVPGDRAGERAACGSACQWNDAIPGQRAEVQASFREWIHGWAPAWKRGRMLTIDYGDEFPHLYFRKPSGTLRAYRKHERLHGSAVFGNFGEQDLTCDVNFTDLVRWGREVGIECASLSRQKDFVLKYAPRAAKDHSLSMERWLAADGAGGAFLVLEQRRL